MSTAEDIWKQFQEAQGKKTVISTLSTPEIKPLEAPKPVEIPKVVETLEPSKAVVEPPVLESIPPSESKISSTTAEVPASPKQPESSSFLAPSTESVIEGKPEALAPAPLEKRILVSIPTEPEKFDGSPAEEVEGLGIMIYALKGDGKTVLAFTSKGKIACISFDQQSRIVRDEMFNKDPRIEVWDAIRYYTEESPTTLIESSERTFRYLNYLLDNEVKAFQPDWVMFDGTEIFKKIAEMTMRYRNNLMPFEGFKNLNLWKERNMYMNQIHNKAVRIAKEGVIYTSYVQLQESEEAGVKTKAMPKWAGDIETRTRVVIRVESSTTKDGREFYATVESSKVNRIPTSGKKLVGKVDANGKPEIYGLDALISKEVKPQ